MVRWDWNPPDIYQGFDSSGARIKTDPNFAPYEFSEFYYLTGSIRSLITAIETGSDLAISGDHLRQSLEVAIACKLSAQLGTKPVKLPLEDRSLALYPRAYRWAGGDETGSSQASNEIADMDYRHGPHK